MAMPLTTIKPWFRVLGGTNQTNLSYYKLNQVNQSSLFSVLRKLEMASSSKKTTLLLAILCLVLLSEVGMLMAQVQTPKAEAPGPQVPDKCPNKCAKRCSKSWKPKMCNKTCIACCHRCPDHCVPDGPTASRDSCHCYSQIKTHGKFKCP
ncbi:hypothetical protein REPUB_Repub16aG0018800 [Reevesia pubescens]